MFPDFPVNLKAVIKRANTEETTFFVSNGLKYLIPQKIHDKAYSTYYTLAVKLNSNKKKGLNWVKFRKKFMQYGGDGIYAASKLIYQEPAIKKKNIGKQSHLTPVAKKLQKILLLFTTNQRDQKEIDIQTNALQKTINFFKLN